MNGLAMQYASSVLKVCFTWGNEYVLLSAYVDTYKRLFECLGVCIVIASEEVLWCKMQSYLLNVYIILPYKTF